jgi:hypothetical protein
MIEPTESESKTELDRFCDAMISIHAEIMAVETGVSDRADNPLKTPRTPPGRLRRHLAHPYSREQAAFPAPTPAATNSGPPSAASTTSTATKTSSAPAKPTRSAAFQAASRSSLAYRRLPGNESLNPPSPPRLKL